jgi:REP element-mobilizing transposase RayT
VKKNTGSLLPGGKYHVYNRGINGLDVFRKPAQYDLFLKKYETHVAPVVRTYAWCFLKNHFHFLVEVKSMQEIRKTFEGADETFLWKFADEETTGKFVSRQFGHLFNGYAQAFNHTFCRTGGLFEEAFRRIPVLTDAYFTGLIGYIHRNPETHGLVKDFSTYPYSSYRAIQGTDPSVVERQVVLDWFGGKEGFIWFHGGRTPEQDLPGEHFF